MNSPNRKQMHRYQSACARQTVPKDVDDRVISRLRAAAAAPDAPFARPAAPASIARPRRARYIRPVAVATAALITGAAGLQLIAAAIREYNWLSVLAPAAATETTDSSPNPAPEQTMAAFAQLDQPLIFTAGAHQLVWEQLYFDGTVLLSTFSLSGADRQTGGTTGANGADPADTGRLLPEIAFEIRRTAPVEEPLGYSSWLTALDNGGDPDRRRFAQMIQLADARPDPAGELQFELLSVGIQDQPAAPPAADGGSAGQTTEPAGTTVLVRREDANSANTRHTGAAARQPLYRLKLAPPTGRRCSQSKPGITASWSSLSFCLTYDLTQSAEPAWASEAAAMPDDRFSGSGSISSSANLPIRLLYADGSVWDFKTDAGIRRNITVSTPGAASPDAETVGLTLVFPRPVPFEQIVGIEVDGTRLNLQ